MPSSPSPHRDLPEPSAASANDAPILLHPTNRADPVRRWGPRSVSAGSRQLGTPPVTGERVRTYTGASNSPPASARPRGSRSPIPLSHRYPPIPAQTQRNIASPPALSRAFSVSNDKSCALAFSVPFMQLRRPSRPLDRPRGCRMHLGLIQHPDPAQPLVLPIAPGALFHPRELFFTPGSKTCEFSRELPTGFSLPCTKGPSGHCPSLLVSLR